jgi:hypothetical protein
VETGTMSFPATLAVKYSFPMRSMIERVIKELNGVAVGSNFVVLCVVEGKGRRKE